MRKLMYQLPITALVVVVAIAAPLAWKVANEERPGVQGDSQEGDLPVASYVRDAKRMKTAAERGAAKVTEVQEYVSGRLDEIDAALRAIEAGSGDARPEYVYERARDELGIFLADLVKDSGF